VVATPKPVVIAAPAQEPVADPEPVAVAAPAPALAAIPAPAPVAAPAPVTAPAPEPIAAPVAAPVLAAKPHVEKSHTADTEKLQQAADVNSEPEAETPESIKLPAVHLNKERSVQYEKDLNSARDQIIKAQNEMKNIDSEVQNFHQKMALSMHSLLKAFTEGFEAMDKAKMDEVDELR
jgi:hypothetical protein